VLGSTLLQLRGRNTLTAAGHVGAGLGDDGFQMQEKGPLVSV
jgi:hypothetical protein